MFHLYWLFLPLLYSKWLCLAWLTLIASILSCLTWVDSVFYFFYYYLFLFNFGWIWLKMFFLFLNFFNSCNYSQILCLKLSYLRKSYIDMHNKKQSKDPEEQKMYYYREDIMYHMFHSLLHSLTTDRERASRNYEQFWYAHQQMMRRYLKGVTIWG